MNGSASMMSVEEGFSEGHFSSLSDDLDLMIDSNDDLLNFGDDSMGGLEDVINEALTNPETPPPLGLKPPSMDNVMEELNKHMIGGTEINSGATISSAGSQDTLMSCLTEEDKDCSDLLV